MAFAEAELDQAIDTSFENVASAVIDSQMVESLERLTSTARLPINAIAIHEAAQTSVEVLPAGLRQSVIKGLSGPSVGWLEMRRETDPSKQKIGEGPPASDPSVQGAGTKGARDLICGEFLQWFQARLEDIRKWVETSGIKQALKQMWDVSRSMIKAAILAIAAVVGSTAAAYLLIGVAIVAVCAAIYMLLRNGVPNYCAASG